MSSIFSSVLTGSFSAGQYILCLLFAGLCGAIAAMALSRESASRSFLVSLVVLPIIVTTVIMMVNGNVGTGVAVAGAFSLVRFRSAAGRAQDISSIFLVMTAGLACAAGYVAVALLFTLVASGVIMILSRVPMSCDRFAQLHITVPESVHFADALQYTNSRKLLKAKTSNMGSLYKLIYRIEMKDPARLQSFLDALRCRNGNLEIAVLNDTTGEDEL